MRIENNIKTGEVEFREVKVTDVFLYNNKLYLATYKFANSNGDVMNAVNLENTYFYFFNNDDVVTLVDATISIKNR